MHTISLALITAASLLLFVVRLLVAKGGCGVAARVQIIERRTAAILFCGAALAAITALAVIVSGFEIAYSAIAEPSHANQTEVTWIQP